MVNEPWNTRETYEFTVGEHRFVYREPTIGEEISRMDALMEDLDERWEDLIDLLCLTETPFPEWNDKDDRERLQYLKSMSAGYVSKIYVALQAEVKKKSEEENRDVNASVAMSSSMNLSNEKNSTQ